MFLHCPRTSFCFGFGVGHAPGELSAVPPPFLSYKYRDIYVSSCGISGGTRPHGLHLQLSRSGLAVTHIPEAQRSVSDEISPRCGSGDYARRAQREQPRYEASSQCWGLSADPSGSTPPGKATSSPTYQDVDRAHRTLAAPGLFTANDVGASQHRGTFKRLNTAALGWSRKNRLSLRVTGA